MKKQIFLMLAVLTLSFTAAPLATFAQAEPDLCDTTAAWVSQVWPADSYVKDENKIWKAKAYNTFTWIKPALTGDGSLSWTFIKDCI